MLISIDHIQLAMPEGEEARARSFYVDILGLREVPKPAGTSPGGAWFENGVVKVHLGVEKDFRPARKAHPAFVVDQLDILLAALKGHGYRVTLAEQIEGTERAHVDDPFGNRIELMAATNRPK